MADVTVHKEEPVIASGGASRDVEKGPKEASSSTEPSEADEIEDQFFQAPKSSFWAKFSDYGVEMRGAEPVPVEKRTDTRYVNVFTVFATSLTSLLPIGIGSVTTIGFGLSLRDAALMIVFLQFLFTIPAAYIMTIAPQTGMRQMIQSRYCFGKYCNFLTTVIVILTVGGFGVTGSINGAQCLAAVRPGTLTVEAAIAIIMVLSMAIGFMGYRVMHFFTRWAWIPALVAILILIGAAGDQLWQQVPAETQPAQAYLGMVAFAAGNMVTWGNVAGDYACYMPPTAPKMRLAMYCLFGLALPFSLLMVFGAAIGGAVFAIPAWEIAYKTGGIGAVLGNILITRLGDFGRFVLVVLGLSIIATCGRDVYSVSCNLSNLTAVAPGLRRVPRSVLSILATAVIIAVAIPASRSFVASVIAFLSIIGYYAGASVTCFLTEYLYFRKGDPGSFDPKIWNDGRALPTGLSALAAVLISWAFIIPSMQGDWYTGPIAQKTGDLGFEFAVVVALLAYIPIRSLEIKIRGPL